jgi:cell wall assembly regulator SMI1
VERTVEASWKTILGWFEQNCPQQHSMFRGPADDERLEAVERATGRPLPADQVAWWRLSDGTEWRGVGLLPLFWAPLSVSASVDTHRVG